MTSSKGHFISFEGIEGVGKSTAIKFFNTQLTSRHIDFVVNREPGGTEISEDIRHILLDHHEEPMSLDTELLLMFACRAQNVARVIKPALQSGRWVISDRFTDASYAYQGYGRGLSIERIRLLAEWVHGDLQPDITFLLDAPPDVGVLRLKNRRHKDRIESEDLAFFTRVRDGYLALAASDPKRFRLIDASQSLPGVHQQLLAELALIAGPK
jgi:dTMP kinase